MASPRVWPPFHLLPPKHSHASTWPQHRIRVPYRICQRCAQGTSDLSCRSLPRVGSSVKSNSESSRVVWQQQRRWVPCQVAWWRPLMQFEGNTATKCNLLAFRGEKSQLGAIHGCQPPALRRLAQSSMLLVHSKEQYWYTPLGGSRTASKHWLVLLWLCFVFCLPKSKAPTPFGSLWTSYLASKLPNDATSHAELHLHRTSPKCIPVMLPYMTPPPPPKKKKKQQLLPLWPCWMWPPWLILHAIVTGH